MATEWDFLVGRRVKVYYGQSSQATVTGKLNWVRDRGYDIAAAVSTSEGDKVVHPVIFIEGA